MPESLDFLSNRFINKIEKVHDYVQIHFNDGSCLNIFNDFSVSCDQFGDLIGCEVVEIIIDESAISFSLSSGVAIRVGMVDADFHGPEAMEYIPITGPSVVWS